MMDRQGFWTACEKLTGPAAVELQWRQLAGDEYNAAKAFLRPTQELAAYYPCTHSYPCGCYHRIIVHSDDNIVAVCTCNPQMCEKTRITKAEIIVYELDHPALYKALAKPLALDIQIADIPHMRWTTQIGFYTQCRGFRLPVFLTIQTVPNDFRNVVLYLLAKYREPFILMAPTHSLCKPDSRELLDNRHAVFLALSDIFMVDESGVFVADDVCVQTLESFCMQATDRHESNEAQSSCRIPKSLFDHGENYRIIWFCGQKLEPLNENQADAVRILHEAAERGHPEMTFGSIASQMKYPPERMSYLFRYNDSRKVLIKRVKADIYRLNV
ncbi:hypothetical protein LLG46_03745 [bacterium]|nr:hypothetical protein [bacterium]